MEYAYKFRIYPNQQQREQIARTLGCCRFVYNHYLAMRKDAYEQEKKTMSFYDCTSDLTQLKKSFEWLREAESTALQSALRDLDNAYRNFFRRSKIPGNPGYPKFKSKHDNRQRYRSNCVGTNIKVFEKAVQLPKLGRVKCRVSKEVRGRILSATVSREPSGKYFVSLCCTGIEIEPLPQNKNARGIDLGYRYLATYDDGTQIENPKWLHSASRKMRRQQRRLARRKPDSNRRKKQRLRVARLHEHIANQRKDFLHKLTTDIIRENQTVCIEDLEVKQMQKNTFVARCIQDVGLYEFRRQLTYKAEWYGRALLLVARDYPSSKTCSSCGQIKEDLKLQEYWTCPHCGMRHQRDANAAKNILKEGLRLSA